MIFSMQNIPESHKHCTYDNFDFSEGKKLLRGHLESFVAGKRNGLILIGGPGLGKTHLMVATYVALQESGVLPGSETIFLDWQELLNYLRSGFELKISADLAMSRICSVKYLIIDDIKPEPQGTFWHQMLELLIEYSYNNKVKIMLSTNANSSDELAERWQMTDYHLSRLTAISEIVVLKGRDRRADK